MRREKLVPRRKRAEEKPKKVKKQKPLRVPYEGDKVLYHGLDRENYGAVVKKVTSVVSGYLCDLRVEVLSPFSGVENDYNLSQVAQSAKPEPGKFWFGNE
jgi:hypothetical protein